MLVVDRFLVSARGSAAVDLATGERVELVTTPMHDTATEGRWNERCARLASVTHRSIVPLVDYGRLDATSCFEAWRCDGAWTGGDRGGRLAIERSGAFLRASGLTTNVSDRTALRHVDGRVAVLPDAQAGYEDSTAREPAFVDTPIGTLGMRLIANGAVTAVSEWLEEGESRRSRAIAIWGARGSGRGMAVLQLARAARLQGYVPLHAGVVTEDVLAHLTGRSVFLIVRSAAVSGWRAFLAVSLQSARPHLVLFAGNEDAPGIASVVLPRVSAETLAGALEPAGAIAARSRRVLTAAARARGLPGRFATLLWGTTTGEARVTRASVRVAERSPAYGSQAERDDLPGRPEWPAWPAPGELGNLRGKLAAGAGTLAAGGYARGERRLRQTIGALSRRGDWAHAAQGAVTLARSLLRRGRAADAHTVVAEARLLAIRAQRNDLLVDVTLVAGMIAMDEVRLDEAEALLFAAVASAKGVSDLPMARAASFELAHCLAWRGRYHAAARSLAWIDADMLADAELVRLLEEKSRIALGLEDPAVAVAQAVAAVGVAARADEPRALAAAAQAAALAHLAVGDYPAVDADVAGALRAARAAREPLLAVQIRLIAAECRRRSGRRAPVGRLMARLLGLGPSRLPAIVRARLALLADLLKDGPAHVVAARHAAQSGLRGLALFAPSPPPAQPALSSGDLVEILEYSQASADGESGALDQICARLRTRLEAAAVAFFVSEASQPRLVAADGGRVEPQIAGRVLASAQLIAPHDIQNRIEAGAPVRCGGRVIGALVARWVDRAACSQADAVPLLRAAAAAAAPALADAIARRAPAAVEGFDLLGRAAAMQDVRRAIERAAGAPFAVLIEGESGCGKELVARALHRRGPRRDRAWCTLNCAALPDELIEAELFGHARGAFTGAVVERPGVFESAHSGTLFLDEVGELSPRAQAKLLRTVQDGEIRRVGENLPRRVDVRLIAATNRDLRQEAATGRFRHDLLYRLDVVRIALPPLRERREDIPELAEHFWRDAAARIGSRAVLGAATHAALARYDWPGNVRELQNVLAALAVRCPRRGVVPPSALPAHFDGPAAGSSLRLDSARAVFEASFVRAALARAGGSRTRASAELGLTRQGLTKMIARLGIAE